MGGPKSNSAPVISDKLSGKPLVKSRYPDVCDRLLSTYDLLCCIKFHVADILLTVIFSLIFFLLFWNNTVHKKICSCQCAPAWTPWLDALGRRHRHAHQWILLGECVCPLCFDILNDIFVVFEFSCIIWSSFIFRLILCITRTSTFHLLVSIDPSEK